MVLKSMDGSPFVKEPYECYMCTPCFDNKESPELIYAYKCLQCNESFHELDTHVVECGLTEQENDGFCLICNSCFENKENSYERCKRCDVVYRSNKDDNKDRCCFIEILCPDCVEFARLKCETCKWCDKQMCGSCDPHMEWCGDQYVCSDCYTAKDRIKEFERYSVIDAMEVYDKDVVEIIVEYTCNN